MAKRIGVRELNKKLEEILEQLRELEEMLLRRTRDITEKHEKRRD